MRPQPPYSFGVATKMASEEDYNKIVQKINSWRGVTVTDAVLHDQIEAARENIRNPILVRANRYMLVESDFSFALRPLVWMVINDIERRTTLPSAAALPPEESSAVEFDKIITKIQSWPSVEMESVIGTQVAAAKENVDNPVLMRANFYMLVQSNCRGLLLPLVRAVVDDIHRRMSARSQRSSYASVKPSS